MADSYNSYNCGMAKATSGWTHGRHCQSCAHPFEIGEKIFVIMPTGHYSTQALHYRCVLEILEAPVPEEVNAEVERILTAFELTGDPFGAVA